jgi:hypothetical protein
MFDNAQTGLQRTRKKRPLENTIPDPGTQRLPDLLLVLCASPGRTCAESGLMLARVRPSGLFELLSADAWAHALGYRPEELSGKLLRELVHEKPATRELVAALLDEGDTQPLDVTLLCKDERRKCFRLHRRFDPYDRTVILFADELPQRPAKVRR